MDKASATARAPSSTLNPFIRSATGSLQRDLAGGAGEIGSEAAPGQRDLGGAYAPRPRRDAAERKAGFGDHVALHARGAAAAEARAKA